MQMWRMPKCVFCLYLSMYTLPHIFRGHKWPLEVFIFNLDLPQQFSSQYSCSLLGIFSLPQKKGNLHIWILSMCYYTLVYKISWQHTKIVSNLFQYILILQTAMYFVQMCTIYNKCVGNICYLKKKNECSVCHIMWNKFGILGLEGGSMSCCLYQQPPCHKCIKSLRPFARGQTSDSTRGTSPTSSRRRREPPRSTTPRSSSSSPS